MSRDAMRAEATIRIGPGESIAAAVDAILGGNTIVYPTETFYGLGASPLVDGALERLFELKAREPGKPVALIAADAEMAFALASKIEPAARRLAELFWPGPLTIVMPARSDLHRALVGEDGGVGVRVSSHPIASALSRAVGAPITATSANLAGQPPARRATEAVATFDGKVKVIVEDGDLPGGQPSTLVAVDGRDIKILREGAIPAARLRAALDIAE
jgi:L-threonylcarbamoyladenylate synthase